MKIQWNLESRNETDFRKGRIWQGNIWWTGKVPLSVLTLFSECKDSWWLHFWFLVRQTPGSSRWKQNYLDPCQSCTRPWWFWGSWLSFGLAYFLHLQAYWLELSLSLPISLLVSFPVKQMKIKWMIFFFKTDDKFHENKKACWKKH